MLDSSWPLTRASSNGLEQRGYPESVGSAASSFLDCPPNLAHLSPDEISKIAEVLDKDFQLRAKEKARLSKQRKIIREADLRLDVLTNSNAFSSKFCPLCFSRFIRFIRRARVCFACERSICRKCCTFFVCFHSFVCLLCQEEKNLMAMNCSWFYEPAKRKFREVGAETVSKSLGKCIPNHPQMILAISDENEQLSLKKLTGAQISKFKQSIEEQIDQLQKELKHISEPLMRHDLPQIYIAMRNKYKEILREILLEFSQVLYINLENFNSTKGYSRRDIDHQVIQIVHEEVEQIVGYHIYLPSEETLSVISEETVSTRLAPSTVANGRAPRAEDSLAVAIVDKVFNNHRDNLQEKYCGNPDQIDLAYLESLNNIAPAATNNFEAELDMISLSGVSERSSRVSEQWRQKKYQLEEPKFFAHPIKSLQSLPMPANVADNVVDSEDPLEDSVFTTDATHQTIKRKPRSSRTYLSGSSTSKRKESHNLRILRQPPEVVIAKQGNLLELEVLAELEEELGNGNSLTIKWIKLQETSSQNTLRQVNLDRLDPVKFDFYSEIHLDASQTNSSKLFRLSIWDFEAEDVGTYMFRLESPQRGSSSKQIRIEIHPNPESHKFQAPTFLRSLANVETTESMNTYFSINVRGFPEPRVIFYKKGKLINAENVSANSKKSKFNLIITPGPYGCQHKLIINSVTNDDAGEYECMAVNCVGQIQCKAILKIKKIHLTDEPPNPRSNRSSISDIDIMYEKALANEEKPNSATKSQGIKSLDEILSSLDLQLQNEENEMRRPPSAKKRSGKLNDESNKTMIVRENGQNQSLNEEYIKNKLLNEGNTLFQLEKAADLIKYNATSHSNENSKYLEKKLDDLEVILNNSKQKITKLEQSQSTSPKVEDLRKLFEKSSSESVSSGSFTYRPIQNTKK